MSQHKTPLRYPGGKQKLTTFFEALLSENDLVGGDYVEPYAGGAGIAIELLLRGQVAHVHLNDSDQRVYAFWRSILTSPDRFCRRISRASLTVEEWRRQREIVRAPGDYDHFDVGFATFYLNRCNRSGILSGGVIGGLKQTGVWKMDARFSRNELIKRIEAIAARRADLSVKNWDAEQFITEYVSRLPKKTLVYCDPPYFNKAERLYHDHYGPEDHQRIARVIQKRLHHPWVVSYDRTKEILAYYSETQRLYYAQQYNAARAYKGTEVFFFSKKLRLSSSALSMRNWPSTKTQRSVS